jgi:hypothetical protein
LAADSIVRHQLHRTVRRALGRAIALQGKNGVKSGDIAPGAIHTGDLANNAVNGPKVANDSLTADDLAPNSVTFVELANDAVNPSAILNGAVNGQRLGNTSRYRGRSRSRRTPRTRCRRPVVQETSC